MIRALTLRNFQAHKKLELRLVPGINTIVGATDKGKSAIIRALGWLGINSPNGSRETRRGAKKMGVSVELSEGVTISRRRGAGGNLYRVGEQTFKAFGKEVPDDVAQALKLGPLNFQFQHDSPFWLSSSAGDVSRQLNQIVDLGIIDSTLANVASELRNARAVVSVSEQRLASVKAKAKQLEHVDELAMNFAGLEGLSNTRNKVSEEVEALSAAVDLAESCAERAQAVELPDFTAMDDLALKIELAGSDVQGLSAMLNRVEDCERLAADAEKEANAAEKRLREVSKGKCPVCGRDGAHDDALHNALNFPTK